MRTLLSWMPLDNPVLMALYATLFTWFMKNEGEVFNNKLSKWDHSASVVPRQNESNLNRKSESRQILNAIDRLSKRDT